ncbi:MAG: GAF domain-containing protein, partial [Candidatus Omnitrophota bacterium]|nr:GAF domain-containing protein [Candidatus Omnitrophota bacterium]
GVEEERAQAESGLLRRDYQLEILSRTSIHINAILEIPQIMRTLIAASMEIVDATAGAAGLLINDKMVFREYNQNGKLEPIDYAFQHGYGVPGLVMDTKKPYISNDAGHDAHVIPEIQKALGFYNLINVPILNGKGELLGCFEIHNKDAQMPFDTQDIFMLQGLAASAAVALENAKMIDERSRMEEALMANELQYRTTINAIADAVHVVDSGLRIVLCNAALKDFNSKLGLETDVIGKTIFEIYPFLTDRIQDEYQKVFHIGKMLITEERNKIGGREIVTEIRKIPLFIEDNIARVVTVIRDITDSKRAEERLEQLNKELLESNKKLQQLVLKDPHT